MLSAGYGSMILWPNVSKKLLTDTRGIRKLVVKYRKEAGITKKASCHTLRHTFATYKAEKGVSAFQLQQWLGHENLNTTQIYVHLGKQNARKAMQETSLP
jgi:integrase/recombinase XerD